MPDQVAHTILEGHDIEFVDLEALGIGDGHALAVYDPHGGGGGGGAVTIADGADVALGSTVQAPASTLIYESIAPSTLIELQKAAKNLLMDISAALLATTTGLGKAEDSIHVSGDTGVAVLAVRKDAAAAMAADGDYHNLEVDATGQLRTTVGNIAALSVGAGATDASTLRVITANDGPVNTVLGTTADAAVSTDANGSINAHLRGIIVDLLAGIPVKGNALPVTATLTVTNGAYTAQDVVGGLVTFANAVSANGKTAVLDSLTLMGPATAIPFEVHFFNADLATPLADNAAFAIVAADQPKWLGCVPIDAADYKQMGAAGVYAATVRGIGKLLKAAGGVSSIYAYMKHTTTTSPGTTTLYLTADFEYQN